MAVLPDNALGYFFGHGDAQFLTALQDEFEGHLAFVVAEGPICPLDGIVGQLAPALVVGVFLEVLCELGGADVFTIDLEALDELGVGIQILVGVLLGDGRELGDGYLFIGVGLGQTSD